MFCIMVFKVTLVIRVVTWHGFSRHVKNGKRGICFFMQLNYIFFIAIHEDLQDNFFKKV